MFNIFKKKIKEVKHRPTFRDSHPHLVQIMDEIEEIRKELESLYDNKMVVYFDGPFDWLDRLPSLTLYCDFTENVKGYRPLCKRVEKTIILENELEWESFFSNLRDFARKVLSEIQEEKTK